MIPVKYIIVCLILVIASTYHLQAQEASHGYIVTNDGDTVRGFIRDYTDKKLELRVEFIKDKSTELTVYTKSELAEFGFDYGRIFKRFPLNGNKIITNDSMAVFAKRILSGKISMYTEELKNSSPIMILVNNHSQQTVILTKPRKIIVTADNGEKYIGDSKKYLRLLNLVKHDSLSIFRPSETKCSRDIFYSIKSIRNDIIKYNNLFPEDSPNQYHPKGGYSKDISIGTANLGDLFSMRFSFYVNKFDTENAKNRSVIRGISYSYSSERRKIDPDARKTTYGHQDQVVSVIPLGYNFHGNAKYIRPYAYGGVGVALFVMKIPVVSSLVQEGLDTSISIGPTINLGAGIKIKAGSNWITAEVTPNLTDWRIFFNMGYSF